jgi:hypothetical protein
MGAIFAENPKAYRSWRRQTGQREAGLSGQALEQAVMGLALSYPNLVEFRSA